MTLGGKRAIGMMLAVLLWTAGPLFACVPGLGAHAAHDCCASMAMPDCSGDTMTNGSCCQIAPAPAGAVVIPASVPKHDLASATPLWETYLAPLADTSAEHQSSKTPPPDPSPGGISVLRI